MACSEDVRASKQGLAVLAILARSSPEAAHAVCTSCALDALPACLQSEDDAVRKDAAALIQQASAQNLNQTVVASSARCAHSLLICRLAACKVRSNLNAGTQLPPCSRQVADCMEPRGLDVSMQLPMCACQATTSCMRCAHTCRVWAAGRLSSGPQDLSWADMPAFSVTM